MIRFITLLACALCCVLYGMLLVGGEIPSSSGASIPASQFTGLPLLPLRFRFKARVYFGSASSYPSELPYVPSLLLFHYDRVRKRSREDYYRLVHSMQRRFYTSIKYYDSDHHYMIYHKQPKSPRACFLAPLQSAASVSSYFPLPAAQLFDPTLLSSHFILRGGATLAVTPTTNLSALHYQMINDDSYLEPVKVSKGDGSNDTTLLYPDNNGFLPIHLYTTNNTFQPLLVTTPQFHLEILKFQILDDAWSDSSSEFGSDSFSSASSAPPSPPPASSFHDNIFNPDKVSKVPCTPFH